MLISGSLRCTKGWDGRQNAVCARREMKLSDCVIRAWGEEPTVTYGRGRVLGCLGRMVRAGHMSTMLGTIGTGRKLENEMGLAGV